MLAGMRAINATEFGGPEVLMVVEAPDPVAGPGEVVIDVAAADTLFLDAMLRRGDGRGTWDLTPPYVPGGGVGGRVQGVGDVVARIGITGGYAERALAAAAALIPVPDGLGVREATALVHDGATALALVDHARVQPGEWVLVTAAAGGLGILLVQMAHAAGGRVIAAARGERKLAVTREHGAEVALDYTENGWAAEARQVTGGAGVNVAFDGAGGPSGRAALDVTAPGGRFSAHGAPGGGFTEIDADEARRREIRVLGIAHAQFAPDEARRMMARALSEAAAGRLAPVIGQTFPLERAADAHAAMEAREAVGKTLLLT